MDDRHHALLAALAGMFTEFAVDLLYHPDSEANWQDLCFAASLMMKGLASMHAHKTGGSLDASMAQVRELAEAAFAMPVLAKKFKNAAEMQAWLDENGVERADAAVRVPASQPTH
jgi:hypothetical protein